MKDKLAKVGRCRCNPLDVITTCLATDHFYFWLKEKNPLVNQPKITSLKRLARQFLAEFPGYYTKFVKDDRKLDELIRIAKTPWLPED